MTTRRAASASPRSGFALGAALRLRQSFERVQWFIGRHLSIRWKLTLWYAAMYALTLVITALLLPGTLQAQTNRVIDQELESTSNQLTQLLSRNHAGPPAHIPAECAGARPQVESYCYTVQQALVDYSTQLSAPGQFAEVFLDDTASGFHPYSLRAGVLGRDISLNPIRLGQVMSFGRRMYSDEYVNGADIRAYLVPLEPPPGLVRTGVVGVLAVFQAKTSYRQIQQALFRILLVAIPAGIAVALTLGWFIARAALRPIRRISRTVQSIGSSSDLSRRLNFVGPQDEVGRLAETFDDMMRRIEQTFESQRQFVADASHELRTPLTAIRGNADLVRRAPPEERDACLTAIQREAERMSRLVTNLLLLAEADIAEQPIHRRPVDLVPILEDVYRSACVIAGDRVAVSLDARGAVIVDADADRIKQLLLNLIDNAVKFTPEGGLVTLSLRSDSTRAMVGVRDTGIGIPLEEQEAIFRRFYRVDKSRATRGTGLGLAISAWIVQAHGGDLELDSTPGKGSTFTICLPLAAPVPTSHSDEYSTRRTAV